MYLNWNEFYQFAKENYCNGGDGVVECWEEKDFDEYVSQFGKMTKTKARNMFKTYKSICDDIRGY